MIPQSFNQRKEHNEKNETLLNSQISDYKNQKADDETFAEKKTIELISDYKNYQSLIKNAKINAENNNALYVEPESQFLVLILIRSLNRMPRKLKTIMHLFRLKKINSAVIVKNNKSNKAMIQKISSYIAFGSLNIENLRELVYKRGYGRQSSLTKSKGFRDLKLENIINLSNENIMQHFDSKLRCIEEIVDSIYFGRESMKGVINFLSPFQLHPPKGGFKGEKKIINVGQGGSTGNHGIYLHKLIMRMI